MEGAKRVIVAVFVGGCLLLFGIGLFLIGNSNQLFSKSFRAVAEFKKITGIQNGGKVRVAGMDAGTVTSIEVPMRPEDRFRVHFRIAEKLHPIVREDSVVSIQTDGLLGSKYLQIDAGTSGALVAKDNSTIPSTEPFDWGDLMDEINGTVKQVNEIIAGLKEPLGATILEIKGVATSANHIVKEAEPQVQAIVVSANKIASDIREITDGVQRGKGTVGALFKDEKLRESVRHSVDAAEKTADNIRDASASAKRITKKVEESEIVPEVQKTVKNLQQITAQIKDAVEKFQSASGEGGVTENLQRTLADAHEAMSDLSEDTEALKHNFLFRGFFKNRGFYDLGSITTAEYRSPKFAKGFKKRRIWLENTQLFNTDAKGVQMLSAAGKTALDEAMTELLTLPRNGPIMIEAFTSEGSASQQYLVGRRRAARVQTYLIDRFHLRPAYVGIVSMGSEDRGGSKPAAAAGVTLEGIGIVSYYK